MTSSRPAARRTRRRASCTASLPPRRSRPGSTRSARTSCVTASTRRRTRLGTVARVFGSFPIPIAGKTGTAEKARSTRPDWTSPGGAATGRRRADSPDLVVCALIENGGHGGDAAAPAALKVFEPSSKKRPLGPSQRLMVEAVATARAAARAAAGGRRGRLLVRRLDWLLLGAVAALVGYGLWAIAGSRPRRHRATRATSRPAGGLRGGRRGRRARAALRRPADLPPLHVARSTSARPV